jgi:adenylate kinase family enzyme
MARGGGLGAHPGHTRHAKANVQSAAIKQALEYMRQGALVRDATEWEMVRERIMCLKSDGGFVLDGFP